MSAAPRAPGSRGPHPAATVLGAYVLVVLAGFVLLTLPIARLGPGRASVLDALFTAVSAVSVTGLTIVDTPTHWTTFGHVVILALVQLGGLGIMTFASLISLAVARRLSLESKLNMVAENQTVGIADARRFVLGAIGISLTIEACTALILSGWFAAAYRMTPLEALWQGVFHAVSSFNNAGFSTLPHGLRPYAADPVICITVSLAVLAGSLGFPVLAQLRRDLRRPLRWTMNTRLVLWGTAVCTLGGTVFVTALEWTNPRTLGPMPWPERILAGFFQAAQTRSGGFSTVDVGQMHSATLLGMDVLMFIGGGPAGTAGGIKLTTFGVLLFIIVTEMRGRSTVNVLGKQLSRSVHRQAITIALVAVATVITSTIVLALLAPAEPIDRLAFEAISAFGTVGLSTGMTALLPPAAKTLLVVLMFAGRLGPILLASALAVRSRPLSYELPKERPIIG